MDNSKVRTDTSRSPANCSIDDCVQYNFDMSGDAAPSWYVKEGSLSVTVKLDPSVNASMSYVKVHGQYGHTISTVTPSISKSGDISFSYGLNTENPAPQTYKFDSATGERTSIPAS